MRIRANFLVAGLILCAGLAHGQNPADIHNGYWWAKQPFEKRIGWVMGFVDGSEAVRLNVILACAQEAGTKLEQFTGPSFEAASAACDKKHELQVNTYKPPKATNGQVITGLDQFYADYRNQNIEVTFAIYYVYGELNEAPQSILDNYVRNVRQTAANQ